MDLKNSGHLMLSPSITIEFEEWEEVTPIECLVYTDLYFRILSDLIEYYSYDEKVFERTYNLYFAVIGAVAAIAGAVAYILNFGKRADRISECD